MCHGGSCPPCCRFFCRCRFSPLLSSLAAAGGAVPRPVCPPCFKIILGCVNAGCHPQTCLWVCFAVVAVASVFSVAVAVAVAVASVFSVAVVVSPWHWHLASA